MKAGVGTQWAVRSIPRKEQQDRSDDKKSQRDFTQCELVNGEVRANVEMQRPAHPECASGHVEQRREISNSRVTMSDKIVCTAFVEFLVFVFCMISLILACG